MPRYIGEAPKQDRIPIPVGQHILALKEIKDYESEDIYAPADPETGSRPSKKQLIWIFESDKKGPDGKNYEAAQFTGLYYGDDRANLTKLLDWMLPDTEHDAKRKGINVELLIGRKYRARVQLVKNQKQEMVPRITMLDPVDFTAIETATPEPPEPEPIPF